MFLFFAILSYYAVHSRFFLIFPYGFVGLKKCGKADKVHAVPSIIGFVNLSILDTVIALGILTWRKIWYSVLVGFYEIDWNAHI